ncbi:MAG: hypothetical protein JWO81_745 [Alphaproteobacteria bacterium]|nr:hypothetical protein [Alphaproteobacteria bacterium]
MNRGRENAPAVAAGALRGPPRSDEAAEAARKSLAAAAQAGKRLEAAANPVGTEEAAKA